MTYPRMPHPPLALWWERVGDGTVRCLLCPHMCLIHEGGKGKCGVREHRAGRGLVSLNETSVASVAVDPVEKKPLYHFCPGSRVLSFGTTGCNLDCPFCQNWQLARCRMSSPAGELLPDQVPGMVQNHGTELVAFTYNEPTVWYEFVLHASRLLRGNGFRVILVTNGYIRKEPLELLLPFISAANVDLKAFTEKDYERLGGQLKPVQETVSRMVRAGLHVELTHLSVPGINDDEDAFRRMVRWIADLNRMIPLHITRYFPSYRWNRPPTDPEKILRLVDVAAAELHYVYPGNLTGEHVTRCRGCGCILVRRQGYDVEICGLDAEGCCVACGARNGFSL